MPALTAEQDRYLATAPTEELLALDILQPENVKIEFCTGWKDKDTGSVSLTVWAGESIQA